MRIGIDIDNVISNFDDVLKREFLLHDKTLRNKGIIDPNKYITCGMFDWTDDEVSIFYNANVERIAKSLTLLDGAKEYIDKLKEDGHSIYIITGRDNGEYTNPFDMTKEWLDKYNIYYDELIFTNSKDKSSKAYYCVNNNIDIMIDDSVSICLECIKNNVTTLLMDKPSNRYASIIRVHNWSEIYQYISSYRLNVILDTDAYNECNDQFAIFYMLKSLDVFNVEAITIASYSNKDCSVSLGIDNSYREVLNICKELKFDTSNKVFKGSFDYMINSYDEDNLAVKKIIEVALRNKKTYIMAIGCPTNVALAIKHEPSIIDRIEVIWLGGNSFLSDDNLEFNFRQDIEVVRTLFDSKVKLTVIPCRNVASNLVTSIYELEHHLKDKSKLCNYLIKRFHNDGYHGIRNRRVIWDISVIAYLINKDWFNVTKVGAPLINDDISYVCTTNRHLITMVNYIDVNKVYEDLFRKLGDDDEVN